MKITLNGQDFDLPDNATIASLVQMRQQSGHLKTPAYAVERNREVVLRNEHAATKLSPGDKVEIVVMVGGG
jgi:sulfur carrier protein